jgi:hypothetical protein
MNSTRSEAKHATISVSGTPVSDDEPEPRNTGLTAKSSLVATIPSLDEIARENLKVLGIELLRLSRVPIGASWSRRLTEVIELAADVRALGPEPIGLTRTDGFGNAEVGVVADDHRFAGPTDVAPRETRAAHSIEHELSPGLTSLTSSKEEPESEGVSKETSNDHAWD